MPRFIARLLSLAEHWRSWRAYMTLASTLRLRAYFRRRHRNALGDGRRFTLRLRSPFRQAVALREKGSDYSIFCEVFVDEAYACVVEHLTECETMIDLGANAGYASLYLGTHFPRCKLFVVEPHPDNYSLLTRNLEEWIGSGRCRTLQAAVWGCETRLVGQGKIGADDFSGFTVSAPNAESAGAAEIRALTIDQIIDAAGFDKIDLLKVDIEGAEAELFRGDIAWLQRVGALAIEFHGDVRRQCRFDDLAKANGFRIVVDNRCTLLAIRDHA